MTSAYLYLKRKVKSAARNGINAWRVRGKTKYFCIGRNKTGTTSLEHAFREMGFIIGHQRKAELLAHKYYFNGNFAPIIAYCRTAEVFQDVPFSYPETFKHVDRAFPGSKFILTVRDDPDQWYDSITRFHAKLFGNGSIPTADDLRNAEYVSKGLMYNTVKVHGTPDDDPYNKDKMVAHYLKHNRDIIDYFRDRTDDLLIINVARNEDFGRFLAFVGRTSSRTEFPWSNKTDSDPES